MFTGIIQKQGLIKKIFTDEKGSKIIIDVEEDFLRGLDVGSSVSINGICLTVEEILEKAFAVTAVLETIDITTIKNWQTNSKVNLERSMLATGYLDGHIVQGHVDGIAEVRHIVQEGDSYLYRFNAYSDYVREIVKKGSIAIDGVSLTIVDIREDNFEVVIIPHTYTNTIFSEYTIGTMVNIETDIVGKYVAKFVTNFAK